MTSNSVQQTLLLQFILLASLLINTQAFLNVHVGKSFLVQPQLSLMKPKSRGFSHVSVLVGNTSSDNDENAPEPDEKLEDSNASSDSRNVPSEPQIVSSVTASSSKEESEDKGVIPRDGSLLILIPSIAITIGGFVLAANIALNSPEQISQAVGEIEVSFAEKFKPKPAIYESTGECRGLCSNQQQDVDNLRLFMEKISGKNDIAEEAESAQAGAVIDQTPGTKNVITEESDASELLQEAESA